MYTATGAARAFAVGTDASLGLNNHVQSYCELTRA
jgi:hypothetical protein